MPQDCPPKSQDEKHIKSGRGLTYVADFYSQPSDQFIACSAICVPCPRTAARPCSSFAAGRMPVNTTIFPGVRFSFRPTSKMTDTTAHHSSPQR